ncbi:unnamed protein product [Brachionus calyciflorus]|uniref:Uncharacterized protein n=1 Tax=Brachionus calyciflorus TaxID=104777 RepID=A0A814KAT6_9BILA|nr:unnamed protein product [Brachionus calyciflorus]
MPSRQQKKSKLQAGLQHGDSSFSNPKKNERSIDSKLTPVINDSELTSYEADKMTAISVLSSDEERDFVSVNTIDVEDPLHIMKELIWEN